MFLVVTLCVTTGNTRYSIGDAQFCHWECCAMPQQSSALTSKSVIYRNNCFKNDWFFHARCCLLRDKFISLLNNLYVSLSIRSKKNNRGFFLTISYMSISCRSFRIHFSNITLPLFYSLVTIIHFIHKNWRSHRERAHVVVKMSKNE